MTPRERMVKAFAFEEIRPTPYTAWYDHQTLERLNAHYGGPGWRDRVRDHILRATVDWEPDIKVEEGLYRDVYGTLWQHGEPKHIVEPALPRPSLRGYRVPALVPHLRAARPRGDGTHQILPMLGYEEARRRFASEREQVLTVAGYGRGIFQCAWMMRGYENYFVDLLANPSFCHELMEALTESHLRLLDALLELPCDGVIFSDDYGDQRGVIIGPPLWRKFVKPYLARLYDRVHQAGKMTFQHTCGSVFDIIPDLVEIGLDVLQSLQPEAMPVYEIKRRYGRDLRLWGGLGTQRLLPMGTPDEIRSETRRLRRELGRGGGYCFSSSKPIMKDVPVENAVAFLEETLEPGEE